MTERAGCFIGIGDNVPTGVDKDWVDGDARFYSFGEFLGECFSSLFQLRDDLRIKLFIWKVNAISISADFFEESFIASLFGARFGLNEKDAAMVEKDMIVVKFPVIKAPALLDIMVNFEAKREKLAHQLVSDHSLTESS